MNTDITKFHEVDIQVVSYSDGIYNIVLRQDNMTEERIQLSKRKAQLICNFLEVELPEAKGNNAQMWG
jgi:hypothetical protein